MDKIVKKIKQKWLSIIAVVLLLIAIGSSVNYYLKEIATITGNPIVDFKTTFFEMLLFQHSFLFFFPPLSIMLLIIDNWHNKFKHGTIKNYLTRMSYNQFKKRLLLSIAKTALIYPAILFSFLLISFILTNIGNGGENINYVSDYCNSWNYQNFSLYLLKTTILLYIQGILISLYSLFFLNKIKNKVLIILFTYITWLVSLLFIQLVPSIFLDVYFNYKINSDYLNFYMIQLYNDSKTNFVLYLLSITLFTSIIYIINYFYIYKSKEKVILTNEKEMV